MESVLTTHKGICYLCQKPARTHLHHIIHAGVSKKIQEQMDFSAICVQTATPERMAYMVHGAVKETKTSRRWHSNYGKQSL